LLACLFDSIENCREIMSPASGYSFPLMRTSYRQLRRHTRLAILFMLIPLLALTSGCSGLKSLLAKPQKVNVPPLLAPLSQADTAQLINEINRLAALRSIKGKVDIQFQDTSFAEEGIAEKYRTADGTVYVQRPGQIHLLIQAPFAGTKIAEMTSDGTHFKIAVLQGDQQFRRFVTGTNNATYKKLPVDGDASNANRNRVTPEQRARSVLSNLRPQHFTDALLVRPIETSSGATYVQSEFFQEEPDTRPRAKSNARVVRGYYMLDELMPKSAGGVRITRRLWFDRVGGIRLARVQTFDEAGALITDVTYSEPKTFGESNFSMPSRIELTRPEDHYRLSVTYQSPESVVLDRVWDADIFDLKNTWNLPEIDLDQRRQDE